jgi:hypothetical protein
MDYKRIRRHWQIEDLFVRTLLRNHLPLLDTRLLNNTCICYTRGTLRQSALTVLLAGSVRLSGFEQKIFVFFFDNYIAVHPEFFTNPSCIVFIGVLRHRSVTALTATKKSFGWLKTHACPVNRWVCIRIDTGNGRVL